MSTEQTEVPGLHFDRIEFMRALLASGLVTAFVGALLAFCFRVIPEPNRDIVTYMIGQLSGMATTAIGFYFVSKVGQDAIDRQRSQTTGKMADAITATANASVPGQVIERVTESVVDGAKSARDEVLGRTNEDGEEAG